MNPTGARGYRPGRRGQPSRPNAPAATDRLAPVRPATRPAGRQRPQPDAENVYGGEVSCGPCLLCSRSRNQSAAIAKTCRSKRAYSFLICTRTLSNSALAARAARSASRAATSAKVHCQATSGSLPSPPGCLTNISPAGSPIERRTAEALHRRSRTSAAKPGLAKYCVRSTIIVALVGIIVPCPNADADGTTGSAAAPAARCRKFRRGSFILNPPSAARLSVRVPWQPHGEHRTFALLTHHRHVATHHARELAGDGEAEPGAAVAARGQGIGLGEILKQFCLLLRRHADA